MLPAVHRLALFLVVATIGCSEPAEPSPPARSVTFEVSVDDTGLSEEVVFEIPDRTRSVTVVVEG